MATVYLAHDLRHDRPVALKVLHDELAAALGPERFQREIRLAARLQHPHILGVHDSGEDAGQLWFTMPFVEGESLRDRLARERQLPVEDAVRIAREAADALEYAHRHGVIHRDIKPENILLSSSHALVADFGIARALDAHSGGGLTGTGMVVGTAAYMSPEQASGDRQLDGRTDIYALACVLYEMVTGEAPFSGATPQAIISRVFSETARPMRTVRPTVSGELDAAVSRGMAKVPADRFPSAIQFSQALQAAAPEARVSGESPVTARTAARRRRPSIPVWAAIAFGFVVGVGVLFAWRSSAGGPAGDSAKIIAVLPFENQSAAEDQYFADGVTDEIRGKLAAVAGLQVIASGSANQYKQSAKPLDRIAGELGVPYLLVGRVRWEKRAGDQGRVRVNAELIRVTPGRAPTTVWQQPFDASLTDVFQVQADIAGRVAQALDVALGSTERRQLGERPTSNLAAYDAYLKAEEANALATGDPGDLRRAIQYYEQAVALDSTFALAYARLSRAQSLLYNNSVPDPALGAAALRSAERAVALAPDRPEPVHALAGFYLGSAGRDRARGTEILGAALRRWPNDAGLLISLATVEMSLGRWESALEHFGQASKVDPRSVDNARRYARALVFLRRYDEALPACDRAIALAPTATQLHQTKAMVYLGRGDLEGARQVMRAMPSSVEPTTRVAYMGTYWDLFWVLDDGEQQLLLRLTPGAFDDNRAGWAIVMAQTYALRKDRARAAAYADTARVGFERQAVANPNDAQTHAFIGLANAYLGRKAEAIAAGERAVQLAPIEREGFYGPYFAHLLARTYILVGELDKAVTILERLLQVPYFLSPGWLAIDPSFEPLRSHSRFQQLTKS